MTIQSIAGVPLQSITAQFEGIVKPPYPGITLGLSVFLILIHIAGGYLPIDEAWRLDSTALTEFNLSKLSMYPLVHLDVVHLLCDIWSLYPLLRQFEMANGTVRTGVVLNVLAVTTGVAYAILDILFPLSPVEGASGWVFSFAAYLAWREYEKMPIIQLSSTVHIPTWSPPIFILFLVAVIFPRSSFLGHALGLVAGYAMGMGYLAAMIEPTSGPILWIEKHLAPAIDLLPPSLITFVKETNAKEIRARRGSVSALPTTEPPAGTDAGRRLGT